MEKLTRFYKEEKDKLEIELKAVKNKLANLSILRLIVFLGTSFGIYFLFDTLRIVGVIGAVGVIVFGILLIKYLLKTIVKLKR